MTENKINRRNFLASGTVATAAISGFTFMNKSRAQNVKSLKTGVADIIIIGDEVISGEIVDTNSAYIAEKLTEIGITVRRIIAIGDDKEEIEFFVKNSINDVEFVITSGGLGITIDDITKQVVAGIFKKELVIDNSLLKKIKERYKNLNLKSLPKRITEIAKIPSGAKFFPNPAGSAPGILIESGKKALILLPGIPREMKAIMSESVIPYLKKKVTDIVYLNKIIRTTGIGENRLSEILEPTISNWKNPYVSFLPGLEGVDIRLRIKGVERDKAEKMLEDAKNKILKHINKWVYTTEDESLIDVVSRLLKEKGIMVAVAESCSGGSISNSLTDKSGSSNYFDCGVVSYSNRAKINILGIPEKTIERYGAVSSQVAVAMAEGIRRIAKTDIGLSTTGIFGPTGATQQKPVGLVYIAYSDKKGSMFERFLFGEYRERNKIKTNQEVFNLLREKIISNF